MKKKRILIFATSYYPFLSGAELAVKEITNRLPQYEYDVVTARQQKHLSAVETYQATTIYRVGIGRPIDKFLLPFLGLFLTLRLHKKNNYHLIWSLMASQASIAAVWFSRLTRIKLLLTLQEGDEETYLKRYVLGNEWLYQKLILPWHRKVITHADHIQVISTYLKDRAKQAGAHCPISLVPNGVDMNVFYPQDKKVSRQGMSEQFGFSEHAKIIFHHGRLAEKNAIDDIIRALRFLPSEYVCLNIGIGEQEGRLQALANELGVAGRVVLYTKHLQQSDVAQYLSAADVFCRPSLSEGFGMSFIEAMATRVPVVATPVGGIIDFVQHEKTGFVCQVRDPQSIAQQITHAVEDHRIREQVIDAAYRMIQQQYQWNTIAFHIGKIFAPMFK